MANILTPNVSLKKPATGDTGWDATLNSNFDTLDSCFGATVAIPSEAITTLLKMGSGGVIAFSTNSNPTLAAGDTGASRIGAASWAFGTAAQGDFSGTLKFTTLTLQGLIGTYNGVATVAGGVPAIVAKADLTAQAANVGNTLLYAVPANGAGTYRVSGYIVITQAATVSSTVPQIQASFTDNDSGVSNGTIILNATFATNTVGSSSAVQGTPVPAASAIFNAKASTNIAWQTSGYASSGATPMLYAVHIKLEFLGN